jgi:hypothetical protein
MTLIERLINYFKPLYDADGEVTDGGLIWTANHAGRCLRDLENEDELTALINCEDYFEQSVVCEQTELQFMQEINQRICEILTNDEATN